MIVDVTDRDIHDGQQGVSNACPIALALNRCTGRRWKVSGDRAENEDGGRIVLPVTTIEFQDNFDEGHPVSPFSFEVPDA